MEFQVTIRYGHPRKRYHLWEGLTSPGGMEAWLGISHEMTWEEGERYRFGAELEGEVRAVRPGERVRITRRPTGWARASTRRMRVEPKGGTDTEALRGARRAAGGRGGRPRPYHSAAPSSRLRGRREGPGPCASTVADDLDQVARPVLVVGREPPEAARPALGGRAGHREWRGVLHERAGTAVTGPASPEAVGSSRGG